MVASAEAWLGCGASRSVLDTEWRAGPNTEAPRPVHTPAAPAPPPPEGPRGRQLGTFRNTYYDFPRERDYSGVPVGLYDARCRLLARVPLGFHDAVCVQGSGVLENGHTVSFARRGCECARRCPRTEQRICFDALDPEAYPWGRGATGRAIVPLRTVAVDSDVIALGTVLFIPEYVGLPRDEARSAEHDGCFVAQDRGVKVRGAHVDIFTGAESMTRLWNELVPSNRGVTVVSEHPACPVRFDPLRSASRVR